MYKKRGSHKAIKFFGEKLMIDDEISLESLADLIRSVRNEELRTLRKTNAALLNALQTVEETRKSVEGCAHYATVLREDNQS